jgi:shikimate kinase
MIIFLFGYPGVGKNYVGETLASYLGFYFWDADLALTSNMQAYIANKQVFSQEMRDQFIQIIIKNTVEFLQKHPNVLITQALYKEKNRVELATAFPEAQFIWIKASPQNILKRLELRNNAVDQTYAEKIQSQFEEPSLPHKLIVNDSDQADIIKQFQLIIL